MDLFRLLVRMRYWLHRPPSRQFLIVALAVVTVGIAIALIEAAGWWPEALSLTPSKRGLF